MINGCFSIGFNYKTVVDRERGQYALDDEKQAFLYQNAQKHGIESLAILNTCNRTELYGFGDIRVAEQLYLQALSVGDDAQSKLIKKKGEEAVKHLFQVASGLDSQIIGDLEILGQFKSAFQKAKKHKALNGYFERLANTAIQASKEVRSKTHLSDGTISVGYAAVKFLKESHLPENCKILLIGTGEFGSGIAKNIVAYMPHAQLFLTNRTASRAEDLAKNLNVQTLPFEIIGDVIADFDSVIVAVGNAPAPIIKANMNFGVGNKIILDMSVPSGLEAGVWHIPNVDVIAIDEVSALINETIENRKAQLPIAQEIIAKYAAEFDKWSRFYENKNSIQAWRNVVVSMTEGCPHASALPGDAKKQLVQKSVAEFSIFLKEHVHLKGQPEQIIEHYLHVVHTKKSCTGSPRCTRNKPTCSECSAQ